MSASGARRMSMAARSSFAENGNEAPPKTMTSIEETGYLLLEDCLLTVIRNDDNNSNEDYCRRLPPRYRQKWIHVNQSSQKQNIPAAEIEPRTTGGGTDPLCRRCQLVLNMGQPTKKDDDSNSNEECILDLCWDNIPPFQGTLLDSTSTAVCQSSSLHQEECSSSSSSHVRIQQRSDAALLAGLLVACSTQVSVVQCLVFFRQEDEAQPHQQHERASLLFTLAFPHLSTLSSSSSNVTSMSPQQQSIPPSSKAPRSIMGHGRISKKPLYPALQLLLTLVRSDWSRLTAFQQQQQRLPLEASQKSLLPKNPSFFPSKLTLGDVYERIPRSSCDVDPWRVGNNVSTTRTDPSYPLSLTMLPTELLVDKIAPFLKASSLAMLRSTSCFLNWSLRGVVPGLKLRLYKHQVNSLSWMRRRELSLIQSEADCFKTSTSSLFDSISYDGDPHRAITGGATVRLASRPDDQNQINYSIHLDTLTGRSIDLDEPACGEGNLPRRVARGGLLCDDPGLGKTVTVLALILQTCGRASSSTDDQADPAFSTQASDANESLVCGHQNEQNYFSNSDEEQNDDDAIFNAYWAERFVAEFRRPALLKLVNGLHRRNAWGGSFPLEAVQKDIMANNFGPNFSDFELSMETAISKYSPDDEKQSCANHVISLFREMVLEFKQSQMRSARKSFSNAMSKPNSRVAALVEEENRRKLLASLISSKGTLIVIPSVLLDHWKTQIELHVNFRYCTNKQPLIFCFGIKDSQTMNVDKATMLCRLNQTHTPMVFIDQAGTRPLPPAEFLAQFQIVITTTNRFRNEAKKGSFQEEIERYEPDGIPTFRYGSEHNDPDQPVEACELLKIQWARMVVDEGHSMGNDKSNSTIQFAAWMNARRRWAMTGTPTKQTAAQIGQLRGLMHFLQHEFFTSRMDGDVAWKRNIARCWKDGELVSFFRLRTLLGFVMKRHTKFDIAELAPPVFDKTKVAMSFLEVKAYNALVGAVQTNLLLTSMSGKTSGLQDSLLHRSQSKSARLSLQNIRRVCTGWSRVVTSLAEKFYQETMELAKTFKISENIIDRIREFVWRAENEELTACQFCYIKLSTLLLMPCCGGLICTECMDNVTTTCYLCERMFDIDELQRFQPGFVLQLSLNAEACAKKPPDAFARPNGHIRPLPDIDEIREQNNMLDLELPLIRPPRVLQKKRKYGDGHICEYDRYTSDGRCLHCLEEHNFCRLLNYQSRCQVCYRLAENCPEEESKSFYLTSRLLHLHKTQPIPRVSTDFAHGGFSDGVSSNLKVIVFSQFRAALNVVGDRLLRRFGTACIAEYFGNHRKEELHKFTYEPGCFCLLLTKDGSEGLDLSFVTNMVFFEEIYDKSLQDQAIARAWRMGSKCTLQVETLVAARSIEEVLGDPNETLCHGNDTGSASSIGDQQRLKSLLQSLRFVTDYHSFSSDETSFSVSGPEKNDNRAFLGRKQSIPLFSKDCISHPSKRTKKIVHFSKTLREDHFAASASI